MKELLNSLRISTFQYDITPPVDKPIGLGFIAFLGDGKPLAQMHYYATHPQSFYGDARISYDTVGIARERLQQDSGVFRPGRRLR